MYTSGLLCKLQDLYFTFIQLIEYYVFLFYALFL